MLKSNHQITSGIFFHLLVFLLKVPDFLLATATLEGNLEERVQPQI